MSSLKAARKAGRRWAWRDVTKYNSRSRLGSQKKKWSPEELKQYRDLKKVGKPGQTKSSLYRRMKRFIRNKKQELELRFKAKEQEKVLDRDEDIMDAQDDRQKEQEKKESNGK